MMAHKAVKSNAALLWTAAEIHRVFFLWQGNMYTFIHQSSGKKTLQIYKCVLFNRYIKTIVLPSNSIAVTQGQFYLAKSTPVTLEIHAIYAATLVYTELLKVNRQIGKTDR